ncbi:uncharacterized protein AB675_11778 [Cyphellophora attinorum]|uniref:Uncharacterized protein n=1 Tax=Cyphellophora attinorum TaxID=1664694 RepID=A0A0N1GZX2_9EURO|nr:uncharacterized protein AB675_11778 [Phialophora attinorum]KPI36784.1 hypothetical protein AB675_11778 [Phialophora attinorum]
MAPIKFSRYYHDLKTTNPDEWAFRRANERSHAARVAHDRRRKKQTKSEALSEPAEIALAPQPSTCILDPFVRLPTDNITTADKGLLHSYLVTIPSQWQTNAYAGTGSVREVSLHHICNNEIVLQWVLLLAESRISNSPLRDRSQHRRRQRVYRTMRHAAITADVWDDNLIYGVCFAIMTEYRVGSRDRAQVHLQAYRAICATRQGLSSTESVKKGPSFMNAMLMMYDVAACRPMLRCKSGASPEEDAVSRHIPEPLKAMGAHWRERRTMRQLRRQVSANQINAWSDEITWQHQQSSDYVGPTPFTNLRQALKYCITDNSHTDSRRCLGILFTLNLFLCWGHDFSDLQVLDFFRKLDQRLSAALAGRHVHDDDQHSRSDTLASSSGFASGSAYGVSPSANDVPATTLVPLLLSVTEGLIREAARESSAKYELVFVWEVLRMLEILVRLDGVRVAGSGSVLAESREYLGSSLLGVLDDEADIIRAEEEKFLSRAETGLGKGGGGEALSVDLGVEKVISHFNSNSI